MNLKKVYKNLYYDEDSRKYMFANDNGMDIRLVVEQQSYLLIYLIEIMSKLNEKMPYFLTPSK